MGRDFKKKSTDYTTPNYSALYFDLAAALGKTLTESERNRIAHIHKSVDILQVNELLFGSSISKETQQMRTYKQEDKDYILGYQKREKLNNIQTANHFKMSRNTIAKWKQEAKAMKK